MNNLHYIKMPPGNRLRVPVSTLKSKTAFSKPN